MIQAITFDVTRTLIHCPRMGEIYAEVLGRHGIEVTPAEAVRLIDVVWRELACSADPARDRWTAHPEGPRGWWQRFLERFCEHLDSAPPSRFAAAELFHRFGSGETWEVYPEVLEVLDALRARRLRLGVISNWDTRLPEVLRQLDLARRFDALVYSSAVGVEKPDPRIFRRALRELGVEPQMALHIGDSRLADVEGAAASGMQSLLLARHGAEPAPELRQPPARRAPASAGRQTAMRSSLPRLQSLQKAPADAAALPDLADLARLPALLGGGTPGGHLL
jgi:putative hydrolase of the HAD superfamily